ncbi:hypothetical protein RMATCC62417_09270 [Rhizopus microsporus]|nr:hypothetical protein RMATCC62417_09270 [Rhizopus microsporus]
MEENFQLKESICDIDSIKGSITQKKRVPVDLHVNLLNALQVIYASNQLLNSINDSISTKYDSNNKEHEDKLLQLWNKLMPNKSLQSRITKQWIDIGFQGNDPATDFRGMGIQGLDDLLFFAEHYPAHARSILEHANDPLQWYPFAIVGINITKFNYQLVESKKLQLYLFEYGTDERAFQEFYCYLFYKFDQFWMFTVMEFESRFNEFKFIVEKELMQQKVKPFSMLIQDNLQIYKDDKKLN